MLDFRELFITDTHSILRILPILKSYVKTHFKRILQNLRWDHYIIQYSMPKADIDWIAPYKMVQISGNSNLFGESRIKTKPISSHFRFYPRFVVGIYYLALIVSVGWWLDTYNCDFATIAPPAAQVVNNDNLMSRMTDRKWYVFPLHAISHPNKMTASQKNAIRELP